MAGTVAGELLDAARERDQEWREEQRRLWQSRIDRMSERELQSKRVCRVLAFLLANALLMSLIAVVGDAVSGVTGGDFYRTQLPVLLGGLLLLSAAVYGLFHLQRVRALLQARSFGVEVELPKTLRLTLWGRSRPVIQKPHAVGRLLEMRRARSSAVSGTAAREEGPRP